MFWLWLLLYGLLFAVPRALMPAAAPLLTPALLAVYWAVLLRCLHTRGQLRSYGLCRGRGLTARDALLSLPVLLFAALNIAFGGARPGIAEAVPSRHELTTTMQHLHRDPEGRHCLQILPLQFKPG